MYVGSLRNIAKISNISLGSSISSIKTSFALGSCGGLLFIVHGVQNSTSFRLFSNPYANGFLSSSFFEYTYLLFWNVFWSIAPVIAIGLFDRIVGKSYFWLVSYDS